MRLAVGVRIPGGNGTEYEPKLVGRVPADAVAALSFGGTQKLVDEVQSGAIPLGDIADQVESTTGVSVTGILDAFSGRGDRVRAPRRDGAGGHAGADARRIPTRSGRPSTGSPTRSPTSPARPSARCHGGRYGR